MKLLIRLFTVYLACTSLLVTDVMARGFGGGGDRRDGGKAKASGRGFASPARPQAPINRGGGARNPITGSKLNKPSYSRPSTPNTRPTTRPAPRPVTRPAPKPVTRPAPKPAAPSTKPTRPSTKPTLPSQRPSTKPALPSQRPSTKPAVPSQRPSTKPALPDQRPSTKPALPSQRPSTKPTLPSQRPSNKPAIPGQRPSTKPARPIDRPQTRPVTRPGNVTYPKPAKPITRPGTVNPGIGGNRPVGGRPVTRPGQNTRPIKYPDFNRPAPSRPGTRPGSGNHWWTGGRPNIGNNINIHINNNFQKNLNWSTNRRYWGYNPWWNRPAVRPWYRGSWNCGWNRRYYHHHHHHYWGGYRPLPGYVIIDDRNDFARAVGWGLAAWGLGKLIFDSGYNTYSNPYPAQPVANVTYQQPITVVASKGQGTAEELERATERSEGFIVRSQDAFKAGNYLAALEAADQAVEAAPGDGALHEYRALVLFALGKYGEAAGVLNPVLASGPGWDWTTMVTLYPSQETYTGQLRRLEDYAGSRPDDGAIHFLLGYHYMVCGFLDRAADEFDRAVALQPADGVSQQLADLCRASTTSAEDEDDEPAAEPDEPGEPAPAPVPLEKLTGTWVADKGADGTITLSLRTDGNFTWSYAKDGQSSEFGGDFSMNDNGLLVLDTDETQMVATLDMPTEDELKFVLAGGPPGDPGLDFRKR